MKFIDLPKGQTVSGQSIPAVRSSVSGDKYIYLMAGVHGDEVEGVYVLQKLLDWLTDETNLKLPIVVIPILNIDGYQAQTRVNANGVDLNRNLPTSTWEEGKQQYKNTSVNVPSSGQAKIDNYFPGSGPLSEPENKFLVELFQKFHPGFIMSIHSWKPILNYNDDCQKIADFLSKYNNYPVADDIGYPTPGSLGTYAPECFKSPVLTFECPTLDKDINLQKIWLENETGLKKLFQSQLLAQKLN